MINKVVVLLGRGLCHGEMKRKRRIVLAPRRDHRTVCTKAHAHPDQARTHTHFPLQALQSQTALPPAPAAPTVTEYRPEPKLWVHGPWPQTQGAAAAEPHREDKTHSCRCTLLPHCPGGSGFLGTFLFGEPSWLCPSTPTLPLAPLSCRCSAGAPLGAPQSLRQVGESWESGGRAGPGPASGRWVLRGPANVAVGGACSGLLWGRTAVGARDRGLGHPAITCSATPEKSPLPSGPQFPSL